MPQLHETLMGKKLLEHTLPDIANSLNKIANAMQPEPWGETSLIKQNVIEISVCYYLDEDDNKVYDLEHMQNEFDEKLKEFQS